MVGVGTIAFLVTAGARIVPGARRLVGCADRARLPIEFQARHSEIKPIVTQPAGSSAALLGELRPAPVGMPDASIAPPVIAESRDPFGALRILDLLARIPRGRPVALRAVVDRLNATNLDWLFSERVVADAILQLQANWIADYRNTNGIVIEESEIGTTITLEDSARVDPWILRQAAREASACREVLLDFSRRERPSGPD